MMFDVLRATAGVLAMLTPAMPGALQPAATASRAMGTCGTVTPAANSGTIFGSLGSTGSDAAPFVKVLPKSTLTLDYAAYLGGLGTPPTVAPGESIQELADGLQRDVARLQSFTSISQQTRLAAVDAKGAFTCAGLSPGEYLVLAQTRSSGYYVAMARVPVVKRNAKQRFLSPVSRFVPAATIRSR